jgi:hypothetical protein
MGSFSLSGGVEVFGFISPSNTTDQYPVIDPLYGIDGLRNVDNLSDLNLIPTLRRRAGMVVGVSGGTTYYKLNLPPWSNTLSDWSIFSSGGGGGVSGDYLPLSGGTVTGTTFFTNGLSANTISGGTFFGNGSGLTGLTDIYVTGATFSGTSLIISRNESQPNITATISTVSLSGALASVSFNIATTGSISASTFSGGTFIGNGSGLTGITDFYVTGGTFSGGTLTLNRQNGSLIVTGFTSTDTFTTAFTYSNNVFTINRNQSLPALTATINSVTGWTVNGNTNITGNLVVTGTSSLNGTISSSGLAGSTDRMVQVSSGGTISATAEIISGYITSGGTVALLLDNNSNWDINGNYSGTTITGTYQGQKHYNANYFYEAVADNLFIRLIRG